MPELFHTFINSNQLRQFQRQVQDNAYMTDPMIIISPDEKFIACLDSECTNILINTKSITKKDLAYLPHIELIPIQPWEPHNIAFTATKYSVKEEMESQNISGIAMNFIQSIKGPRDKPVLYEKDVIFHT